jgi:polar amino acid transport system substrate-binding protein
MPDCPSRRRLRTCGFLHLIREIPMKLPSLAYSCLSAVLLLVAASIAYQPAVAHADALADIKKAGVINVGVFEDFPPFASAGPDMRLHGYDIDVATALAAALGVKLNLVAVTGQNRIPYLQDHKVDILLSVGDSPEREKVIDFTSAYAPYYIAVLGPHAMKVTGPADLAGKSIGVNRGTLEDTSVTSAAPSTADIRRFDNYNGVITAFLSGQVQLIVVGNDVGAAVLARHPTIEPEEKFELLTSPDHIALNKNEPALKSALNDAIAKMKSDGSLNEISVKWLHKPLNEKDL